jgi:hypothetical protein
MISQHFLSDVLAYVLYSFYLVHEGKTGKDVFAQDTQFMIYLTNLD